MTPSRTRSILTWFTICFLLMAAMWLGISMEIRHEHKYWSSRALQGVGTLAENYAEQLEKSIEQIDLMSSSLVYMKERGILPTVLDEQFQYKAFETPVYVAYIDAEGIIRSARYIANIGTPVGKQPFLEQHRKQTSRALLINPRARGVGTLVDQDVIRFTRRVNKADGSFDGVISITINHTYLHSYKSSILYAEGDFASAWLQNGPMLTNWTVGLGQKIFQHYRVQPQFAERSGAIWEPAEKFEDNEANFVGWRKLEKYPLVALSAIREANAMRSFELARNNYLLAGSVGSLLILSGSALGLALQIRRARRRQRMNAIHETFRLAIDTSREALFMIVPLFNSQGQALKFRIEDCSERTGELIGTNRHALRGKTFDEVFSQADATKLQHFLRVVLSAGFNNQELQLFGSEGKPARWYDSRAVRANDGIALAINDVTELKETRRELATMARTDALTGLPNRVWLREFLPAAFALADAQGRKLALVLIDIFDFKRINDSIGHDAGDDFLVAFGHGLRQAVRNDDHVARIGGDKFAVLINGIREPGEIAAAIDHIRHQLSRIELDTALSGYVINQSIGVALYPDDAAEPDSLLNAADVAMYDATAKGDSAVVYYSHSMSEHMQSQFRLERELRHALMHEELCVHYQPRMHAATGVLSSFEALVRWNHPQRGLVMPAEFIPVAEESGLIDALGNWVIEQTCRDIAGWRQQGLPPSMVSINVSAKQLKNASCRTKLVASMATHGIAPSQLAIELTESTMVGSDPGVQHELHAIRELGIELHIDDFGTGYSSLSQLQQLEVDALKIDQSFVRELGRHKQSEALCQAIIEMCKVLGFTVIAEGVETPAQLHLLQQMGCDEIQGYLLSRAVPAEAAATMLARTRLYNDEPTGMPS